MDAFEKQLVKLKKKEQKILGKKEGKFQKEKIRPAAKRVEEKIPPKLLDTLNAAFYKGFCTVFDKGTAYIEKMYDKEKIDLEYDVNNYRVDKAGNSRALRELDRKARRGVLINKALSTAEGAVLGILGIGLPDIPLFLSVILKTVYEISLNYGYDYQREEEKVYILNLIAFAVLKEEEKKEANERLDKISSAIDSGQEIPFTVGEAMNTASGALSQSMLLAKFIQGFAVIGAVGAVSNYCVLNEISRAAALKYKKRYLIKKQREK